MSKLSEEEIIKILKHVIEPADIEHMSFYEIYENYVPLPKLNEAIQGLLDLYQKEKEKREKLEIKLMEQDLFIDGLKEDRRIAVEEIQEQYYVSKDKIRELLNKLEISDDLEAQIAIPYMQELLEERN